jgi:hypothetical protein
MCENWSEQEYVGLYQEQKDIKKKYDGFIATWNAAANGGSMEDLRIKYPINTWIQGVWLPKIAAKHNRTIEEIKLAIIQMDYDQITNLEEALNDAVEKFGITTGELVKFILMLRSKK